LWKGIFSTKKEKEPKRKKAGGLMETDAAVEKQKRFFHSSLQNAWGVSHSSHTPGCGSHSTINLGWVNIARSRWVSFTLSKRAIR